MTERYEIPSLSTKSEERWTDACERLLRDAGLSQSGAAEQMAKRLGKKKGNLKSALNRFIKGNPDKLRPWFNPRSGHSPELECLCELLGITPRQLHQELLRAAGLLPDLDQTAWHIAFPEVEPAEAFVEPPVELGRGRKKLGEIVDQVVEKTVRRTQYGDEPPKAILVTLTGGDGSGCRSLAGQLADKIASRLHREAAKNEDAERPSYQHKPPPDPRVVVREPRRGLLLFDSGAGPVDVELSILRPRPTAREETAGAPRKADIELSLAPWRISEGRALARKLGQGEKIDADRRRRLEIFADTPLDELQDSEYLPGDAIWIVSVVAERDEDSPPTAAEIHRLEAERSWDAAVSRDPSGLLGELPDGFPAHFWAAVAGSTPEHVVLELRREQVEAAIRAALDALPRGSAATPALRSALDGLGDAKGSGRERLADALLRGVLAGEARAVLDALLAAGHLDEREGFLIPSAPRAARTFAALGLRELGTVPWGDDGWEGLLLAGALDLCRELAICGFSPRQFCEAVAEGPPWCEVERAFAVVVYAASASAQLPPDLAETVLIPAWRTAITHWHFARTLVPDLRLRWFDWVTGNTDLEHPPSGLLRVSERYREVLPQIPDGHIPPWPAPALWEQRFRVSESVDRDYIKPEWFPVLAWRKTILAAAPWQALDTIFGLRLGEIDLPDEALEALSWMRRESHAIRALLDAFSQGDRRALKAIAWPSQAGSIYFGPGPGIQTVARFVAEPPSPRAALTRFFELMRWMGDSLHESEEPYRKDVCVKVLSMLDPAQQTALLRTSLGLPYDVAGWLPIADLAPEDLAGEFLSLPHKAPTVRFAVELAEAVGNKAFLDEVVGLPERIAATCRAGMVAGHVVLLRPHEVDVDLRREKLPEKVGEVEHLFGVAHQAAMALLLLGYTDAAEKWLEPEALAVARTRLVLGVRGAHAPVVPVDRAVTEPQKLEELPTDLIAELRDYVESQRKERTEARLELRREELVPLFHVEGSRDWLWSNVAAGNHDYVSLDAKHPWAARWLVSMLVPQRHVAKDERGHALWMPKGYAEKTRTETRDIVLEALLYAIDSRGRPLPPRFAEWVKTAQAKQQWHDTDDGWEHTPLESQVEATATAFLGSRKPELVDHILSRWINPFLEDQRRGAGRLEGEEREEAPPTGPRISAAIRSAIRRALENDLDVLDRAWELAADSPARGLLVYVATEAIDRVGEDRWRQPTRLKARTVWAAEAIGCLPLERRRELLTLAPGVAGVGRLLKDRYRAEDKGRNRVLWAALLAEGGHSLREWREVVRRWTEEEEAFTGFGGFHDAENTAVGTTSGWGPPTLLTGGDYFLLEGLVTLASRSPPWWLDGVKRLWKRWLHSPEKQLLSLGGHPLVSHSGELDRDPLKVLLQLLVKAGETRWALRTAGFPLAPGEPARDEERPWRYLGYDLYDLWAAEADWRAVRDACRASWRLYSHGWFKLIRGTPPRALLDDCRENLARLLESGKRPGDEDFEWFMVTEPLTLHRTADLVRLLRDECPPMHPARQWFVRILNSYADLNGPLPALYRLEREWAIDA